MLLVDDQPAVAAAHARALRGIATSVSVAHAVEEALSCLSSEEYDVVVTDLSMPGLDGVDLLRAVRERDLDLPVIFLTGAPTIESAAQAVELGAFRYLTKPVAVEPLRVAVLAAARTRALARTKAGGGAAQAREALDSALRRALASLRMAYQPIVSALTHETVGYEALMRSSEPTLPSPPAVLDAAEKLGSLHALGRRTRSLVALDIERTHTSASIWVNLHSADLADAELFDAEAPLSRHARQVVLEITERASLESIGDLDLRLQQLRSFGYRLAVDDLGAGYAGLSYFARVQPELVKIDMSLVRGLDRDPVNRRVVLSLSTLATSLGMEVVAEGVETREERDAAVQLGCTYVQGYGLAKPGPPFPVATWS